MTAATKFMFDTQFETVDQIDGNSTPLASEKDPENALDNATEEQVADEEEEEEELPGYSEAQYEAAKAESFEAGKQEGAREAASTIEKDMLMTIQAISLNITELFSRQEQANNTLLRDGIGIATTIARKLFPAMNEQNSHAEIDRLVEHTLLRLIEEPRVVIRINPDLQKALSERVEGLKAGAGYEGRIIIKEDDSLPYGDCRMEWGDGSAERNVASLWQSIDQIIGGNLGTNQRQDDDLGGEHGAVEVTDVLTAGIDSENVSDAELSVDGDENAQQSETGAAEELETTLEPVIEEETDQHLVSDPDAEIETPDGTDTTATESEDANEVNEITGTDENNIQADDEKPKESDMLEPIDGENMNSVAENGIVDATPEVGETLVSDSTSSESATMTDDGEADAGIDVDTDALNEEHQHAVEKDE